ncbi:amino acid ABC transporter substrate-binding protein [Zavarzinia compransoris]|uniref:amino acid ABC transporter substrate-binding protein n=1 Tax=Zavarzinia compransoris TaxID=1264899 RepID=UPI0010D5E92C|nr:amino acid ABC transporter substrate-binding protein [Zavarzinia compransoris]TDP45583.1 amino acid/amide ABC transporter substrate-binding protein (HAAT family) [Zavarzinia compransoris]
MLQPKPSSDHAPSRRSLLQAAAGVAGAAVVGLPRLGRAQAAGTVHFGASLPLTGAYEKVAKVYRDGYDFWTRTVGGRIEVAGMPMAVKWSVYDDENNASRTAQLTEKLISDDKVNCIAGAYGTDTVLAQGAIAGRHGRVLVQAGAASTRVDEEIGGKTAFTLVGGAKTYQLLAVDFLARQNPKPKTAGIVIIDDPVYQEHAIGIRERCAQHGIDIVFEDVLPPNVQDLRPTVLKMKRAGEIDLVFNTGWDLICIKLVQEMSTLGVVPKAFVGGHLTTTPAVKQSLGSKLRNVIGVTFWTPALQYKDPHFEGPRAFLAKFEETFGYTPTYHAAAAYSVPLLYQMALKDADPADPFNQEHIRQNLLKVKTETVWGPISFNERGRIQREGVPVIQWLGDDPVATVVYPEALATAPGVYPRGPWG